MIETDFLVVGGGIIGLSVARELKRRHHGARVVLIEKENDLGAHASGRNSGVLHAGFYYTADSLKARFCRNGNRRLTEYCESKGLRINKCGKLVVAKNEDELLRLNELLQRGMQNGVALQLITAEEARAIEPRVKTFSKALFSPTTSTVDPMEVMRSLAADARREGIDFRLGASYISRTEGQTLTSQGPFKTRYLVNTAGLYADRIARDFGFSQNYRILPFKGLYLYAQEPAGTFFRTNIYPVPDLRNPFLGVHFTLTVDGKTKIGPTATPAFWREQYAGWDRFRWEEFLDILLRQAGLFFFSGFDFKGLAMEELRKYSKAHLVSLATGLAENIRPEHYKKWGKPGIRAQLLNTRERKLEMDFVLEGDDCSLHVLNAVSPGFTCALPFAEHVCDEIERRRK
jgi:L-2-hydroxyglutarate oxidase LhgO